MIKKFQIYYKKKKIKLFLEHIFKAYMQSNEN